MFKHYASRYSDIGRFNSIILGGVKLNNVSEDFQTKYGQKVPSKKMLQLSQLIEPVKFLLSNGSSGVNGTEFVLDEGFTIW